MSYEKEKTIYLPTITPIPAIYPAQSALFSILPDTSNVMKWKYNNYIQIWCQTHIKGQLWGDYFNVGMWNNCPFIENRIIPTEMVSAKWDDIIDFTEDCLGFGYYMMFFIDTYFIKGSDYYQHSHFPHEVFVHGLDKSQGIVNIADFYVNSLYTKLKCDAHDFQQAYESYLKSEKSDYLNGIALIKTSTDYEYEFNIPLIKSLLEDFIDSGNTNIRFGLPKSYINDHYYGLAAIETFISYCYQLRQEKKGFTDHRLLAVLKARAIMMIERIKFMEETGFIKNGASIINGYKRLTNIYDKSLNLFIKFRLARNIGIMDRIIENCKQAITFEREAANSLLLKLL